MKDAIEQAINTRLEGFKDRKSLLSLYKTELDTNKGYNGRQLLEMFQNCEDEGAKKVVIHFDTSQRLLEISNDGGKPFSVEGYDSLLYPGLSSKVSSGFIGNKGLGFRSIINWAEEIRIISNGFIVEFKEEYKKEALLETLKYSEDAINEIRTKRKLKPSIYPIPLLNCGKVRELEKEHLYTTTISVRYKKEYETDIEQQIKDISDMTLLFLNNIEEVIISGNTINERIKISREKNDFGITVKHDEHIYFVIEDEGEITQELITDNDSIDAKRYSVKIAFSDDLTLRDEVLYNYFKTKIPFKLPFVAHASLELDQNRNHGTESAVNPFVFQKLFGLHLRLIEYLKRRHKKSWLPYQSIDKESTNVTTPYSQLIDGYWDKFEVYPTISGQYFNREVIRTLGNRIADFLEKYELRCTLNEQVLFCEESISALNFVERAQNYREIIEDIASELDVDKRAEFIKLLLEEYPRERFSVLIDNDGRLIHSDDYVYTDKTAGNDDIRVPSYSSIRFIHPLLYKALVDEFNLREDTHHISRSLRDKLQYISDVHSFEPQTVIKKIISETNERLKQTDIDYNADIKEFYQVLFHNYLVREENPTLDYEPNIPCLNQNGDIIDVRDVVLSDEFQTGKLSSQIFQRQIYNTRNILAPLAYFGLEHNATVEEFFKWLGVQLFLIIEKVENGIDNDYKTYINRENDVDITSYEIYLTKDFDSFLNKCTINQVIAWVSYDKHIQSIFSNFTQPHSNDEKLSYQYYKMNTLVSFENLIHYKISKHFIIDNYLITNKSSEWFNPFSVDYEYLRKQNEKLTRSEVDRILKFFGAKDDFNDLDIDYLKIKTQELADSRNPKGAQVFYKNLVGHYKQHQLPMAGVDLFAKEGNNIVVKHSNEIYYSDRIQLPEVLTKDYPIFYYPSRSGGVTAIDMFGLNNLNDLDLVIEKRVENVSISTAFNLFIKEIKPFILAFRLEKISKEEVRKSQVSKLNSMQIKCCSKIECSIDEKTFQIEPYNYVFNSGEYFIRIPESTTIDYLKTNKEFINNLSDIFLKVFDTIDEKKTFENIIRQSKEDNIYDVENDLAQGILEEAKQLLGEINVRLTIWKGIFRLKYEELLDELNDTNLDEYICEYFPEVEEGELFNSADKPQELNKIRNIFQKLAIDLGEYNSQSDLRLSFDSLFARELNDYYIKRKKTLRNQLWFNLKSQNKKQQGQFLSDLNKIESLLDNTILNQNQISYDFEQIIKKELETQFYQIEFDLNNFDYEDYDTVQLQYDDELSFDEKLALKDYLHLESLRYFEGHIDYLKSELIKIKEKEQTGQQKTIEYELNKSDVSREVKKFNIILETSIKTGLGANSRQPWLGSSIGELSESGKKKLGNDVETIVYNHLKKSPYCKDVEHISKTDEGLHYDIRYFDTVDKKIKYVECKYYNGISFMISGDEKRFADSNIDQYEIWLVDKDVKIYPIKDIRCLGELQAINYKVNLKLKEQSSAM